MWAWCLSMQAVYEERRERRRMASGVVVPPSIYGSRSLKITTRSVSTLVPIIAGMPFHHSLTKK